MNWLKSKFLEDATKNELLRDFGVASIFLAVAILLNKTSTPVSSDSLIHSLTGVAIGFALAYVIRSLRTYRTRG